MPNLVKYIENALQFPNFRFNTKNKS